MSPGEGKSAQCWEWGGRVVLGCSSRLGRPSCPGRESCPGHSSSQARRDRSPAPTGWRRLALRLSGGAAHAGCITAPRADCRSDVSRERTAIADGESGSFDGYPDRFLRKLRMCRPAGSVEISEIATYVAPTYGESRAHEATCPVVWQPEPRNPGPRSHTSPVDTEFRKRSRSYRRATPGAVRVGQSALSPRRAPATSRTPRVGPALRRRKGGRGGRRRSSCRRPGAPTSVSRARSARGTARR